MENEYKLKPPKVGMRRIWDKNKWIYIPVIPPDHNMFCIWDSETDNWITLQDGKWDNSHKNNVMINLRKRNQSLYGDEIHNNINILNIKKKKKYYRNM